jgi:hypothetical protein
VRMSQFAIRWESEEGWVPERTRVIAGLPVGLEVEVGSRVGVRGVGVRRMIVMNEPGISGASTRLSRRRGWTS